MADRANPSRAHTEYYSGHTNIGCSAGGNEDANVLAKVGNGGGAGSTHGVLRHDPGISLVWTPEEQSILEDLLSRYCTDTTEVQYFKIARALKDKTIRDVAFRCIWMRKKGIAKQRKKVQISSKKNENKKEYVTDSMPVSSQFKDGFNCPPHVSSTMMGRDDGITYKMIGGASGKLLEKNASDLDQIFVNISELKLRENISLLNQARLNILRILNNCRNMPEMMKQMPPLPVQLNEELAANILQPLPLPVPYSSLGPHYLT